ncbi:MAG: nif-specific transcriptional activator NifA [Nitrospirae bacterium]|nr:nif-specific transcriptional activator NifA [Nitrospirota bacterium]
MTDLQHIPVSTQKGRELAALYEVSKILASTLDLEKALLAVLRILDGFLEMKKGTVTLVDPDTKDLFIEAALDLSEEERRRIRYRVGEGITGKVLATGLPMVIPDVGSEPLFLDKTHRRPEMKVKHIAFVAVPIRRGRETLGVMSIDRSPREGMFSYEEDLRFLSMVANLIGQTVALHRQITKEREDLLEEQSRLKNQLHRAHKLDNIVGQSKVMHSIFEAVKRVAPSRATVLLRGESGTGKELIARAIHYNSPRADGPFIALNCAALPETLLEAELFGYEKGAFTGATGEKKGRFELAHGGTLFLDEIGDMPLSFQAKLLRVLQEKRFERLGGTRTLKVDVRLIAATNRNLEEAVSKGAFRSDLYFRVNVVTLYLPPLRERREDIPPLAQHILKRVNQEYGRSCRLTTNALEVLMRCAWPGNVRELENCLERVVVMQKENAIAGQDFHCESCPSFLQGALLSRTFTPGTGTPAKLPPTEAPAADSPEEDRRLRILETLERCGWVQAKAARMLGLTVRQLNYRIQKYGIEVRKL